ncbi:hypothetical protein [Paenibacillus solani]|uniref:DUF3939 domain-containing protein n=1 Tax=Paenibacillus solani TaxID=1705565 RepID=A0A0M1P3X6_9BACL|nr:hypothetical protein [Paenibacillus solani]KOR88734.1 hypothetical protein AM231_05840 [Paenibacillus solani]
MITWITQAAGRSKRMSAALVLVLFPVLLTGCLYPGENMPENKVSYRESVKRIQSAVDDFYQEQGILPIITAGSEIPRYEKYRVDLDQLKNRGYMDQIPNTAFEKGGSGYFLIINEETEPTVKVMDLTTTQKVNDVQRAVNLYKMSHDDALPAGEALYPGYTAVDLSKTDAKSVKLNSVYSGQEMTFIMDENGTVYADYAFDIMQAIQKNGTDPKEGEDLRRYLEQESSYVPVKSVPYTWQDGQPVAQPLS